MRGPWMAFRVFFCVVTSGCASLSSSQLNSCHRYNVALQKRYADVGSRTAELQVRNGELAVANLDLERQLEESDRLIANLQTQLATEFRYDRTHTAMVRPGLLPGDVQLRLTELSSMYPSIVDIDPISGISRFRSDLLFAPGESGLSDAALAVLADVAELLRHPQAAGLQVMVVGHTHSQQSTEVTQSGIATNWHLSADRAISVANHLETLGIDPRRLAATSYGSNQPISTRPAENRRVELYLIPAETPMVGTAPRPNHYR